VIRSGRRPLIAVVQRQKDDGWVLPKGKLKSKETALAAARREVVEETGQEVSVHDFLGAISYRAAGRPKIVQFWLMQSTGGATRKLMDDIKAVEWLTLNAAVARLTQPLERIFLKRIGQLLLKRQSSRRTLRPYFTTKALQSPRARLRLAKKLTARKSRISESEHRAARSVAVAPNLLRRFFGRLRDSHAPN
jgi:8-oxo-dGTP diphosphatase